MDRFCLPDMLNHYVRAIQKGIVVHNEGIPRKRERDETCFHCSETLKCHRMRIFRRIGATQSDKSDISLRRFLLGDVVESIVRQAVVFSIAQVPEYRGFKAEFQEGIELPLWETRGSMDLTLIFPDKTVNTWDIKSCHGDKIDYVKMGEKDLHYHGQVTSYRMGRELKGEPVGPTAICYLDKDTMATHADWTEPRFEQRVAEDYGKLMSEWERYKKTKEVPPELPYLPERERFQRRKRYTTENGMGMFPQWTCDPKYCDFAHHCPKVMAWWNGQLPRK